MVRVEWSPLGSVRADQCGKLEGRGGELNGNAVLLKLASKEFERIEYMLRLPVFRKGARPDEGGLCGALLNADTDALEANLDQACADALEG